MSVRFSAMTYIGGKEYLIFTLYKIPFRSKKDSRMLHNGNTLYPEEILLSSRSKDNLI